MSSLKTLSNISVVLDKIAYPTCASICLAFILAIPDQIRENYRYLYEQGIQYLSIRHILKQPFNLFDEFLLPTVSAVVALALFSFVVILTCNWLLNDEENNKKNGAGTSDHPTTDAIIIAVISILPILGVVIGLLKFDGNLLPESVQSEYDSNIFYREKFIAATLLVAGVICAAAFSRLIGSWKLTPSKNSRTAIAAVWGVTLGMLIFFSPQIAEFPRPYFGLLPIICLFFAFLTFALVLSKLTFKRYSFHVFIALIALAVCLTWLGRTNNHELRQISEVAHPRHFTASFIEWFDNRNDKEWYRDRNAPYPIYVVAAEGGGIYAAQQTLNFLSEMQDVCRNFAQHTFGISSVSGGSLGAAVFSIAARNNAPNAKEPVCASKDEDTRRYYWLSTYLLQHDYLSTISWYALFPDFLQRFWPWPVNAWDRGKALERSFEGAWNQLQADDNRARGDGNRNIGDLLGPHNLGTSIYGLWDSAAASPALFVNSTNVADGKTVVMAPFLFKELGTPGIVHLEKAIGNKISIGGRTVGTKHRLTNLALSTAVGVSARFPLITPTGWIAGKGVNKGKKIILADGGYSDNTGISTAIEIKAKLEKIISLMPARFGPYQPKVKIIVIGVFDASKADYFRALEASHPRLFYFAKRSKNAEATNSEVVAPFQALLAARTAKGNRTLERLMHSTGPHDSTLVGDALMSKLWNMHYAVSQYSPNNFPLGWQLSRATQFAIEEANGSASLFENNCTVPYPPKISACTMLAIKRSLLGQGVFER